MRLERKKHLGSLMLMVIGSHSGTVKPMHSHWDLLTHLLKQKVIGTHWDWYLKTETDSHLDSEKHLGTVTQTATDWRLEKLKHSQMQMVTLKLKRSHLVIERRLGFEMHLKR
jgi:hypothetical protein